MVARQMKDFLEVQAGLNKKLVGGDHGNQYTKNVPVFQTFGTPPNPDTPHVENTEKNPDINPQIFGDPVPDFQRVLYYQLHLMTHGQKIQSNN